MNYSNEEQAKVYTQGTVSTADLRFYPKELDGELHYLPSVTTIIDKAAPKHDQLIQWFKQMPAQEQAIHVAKAANEGSNVHNALELYAQGHPVKMFCVNEYTGEERQCYSMKEWEMIGRGVSALNTLKMLYSDFKVILVEQKLANAKLCYAGTCDLVVYADKQYWLIDHKTSNSLSDTMHQQTFAYKQLIKEELNIKISRRFILWLKANTRTYNQDKLQGKGWQLVEHTDDKMDKKLWDMYLFIFKEKYGNSLKPSIKTFPSTYDPSDTALYTI